MKYTLTVLALGSLLLAGCGSDDTTASTDSSTETATSEASPSAEDPSAADTDVTVSAASGPCAAAFADSASVSDVEDTVEDLYPAIEECQSVEDWEAASEAYPDALDGAPPVTYLANNCGADQKRAGQPLCQKVISDCKPVPAAGNRRAWKDEQMCFLNAAYA